MVPFVLALVPILVLIAGGAVRSAWCAHVRFRDLGESFRCNVRSSSGDVPGVLTKWRRRHTCAVWAHDVLLVKRGLLARDITVICVRGTGDVIRTTTAAAVPGLGPDPVVLELHTDDGALVELAAPRPARTALAGPFLAAAIADLPSAPPKGRCR